MHSEKLALYTRQDWMHLLILPHLRHNIAFYTIHILSIISRLIPCEYLERRRGTIWMLKLHNV